VLHSTPRKHEALALVAAPQRASIDAVTIPIERTLSQASSAAGAGGAHAPQPAKLCMQATQGTQTQWQRTLGSWVLRTTGRALQLMLRQGL